MILPEGEPIPFVGWVEIDTKKINNSPRELSDEEILNSWVGIDLPEECWITDEQLINFARAILRKAQEK